jgi:predicted nucleic acid-binding protein
VKKRFKLYLETSFWRRLVDDASDPRRIESFRFLSGVAKGSGMVISNLVRSELETTPGVKERVSLRRRIRRVGPEVLIVPSEAAGVADRLLAIQRRGSHDRADMLHVACAMLYGADALVSWDRKDIACGGTRAASSQVARELGLASPRLGTPKEIEEWLRTA